MSTETRLQDRLLVLAEPGRPSFAAQLTGFWAGEEWDMAACPLLTGAVSGDSPVLRFDCDSPTLNEELKYACWRKFAGGDWSVQRPRAVLYRLRAVVVFLQQTAPGVQSLLERSVDDWLSSFTAYLERCGSVHRGETLYIDKSQHWRRYPREDPRFSTFRQLYQVIQEAHDQRPEYERDIWDVRRMGAVLSPADASYRLNFTHLRQDWLRQAAKLYLRYRLPLQTVSTCNWVLHALNLFSAFLAQLPQPRQAADIDRTLILEYLAYLATTQKGARTRQNALVYLRNFMEVCVYEGWADFPARGTIYEEDIPGGFTAAPHPIPEDVLEQLNQHLASLPEPYRTMVLVVQECGMRVSELCSLALDCLSQDQEGDWFLHYYQWKMKKEHSIPLTHELARIIQQQQQVVREKWGQESSLLFPSSKGQPLSTLCLSRALNRLACAKDIRDSTGRLFRFRVHDFRHTVGTRMIRQGVQLHHVQRYLGHESPEMTMVYARITDQDLKRAFAAYQQLAVDVTGKVVATERAVDTTDLQWFKKNIMAQALPHGYCALPALAEPCPFPNACLTCASFRTNASFLDVLRRELAATEGLLDKAQANHWTRQIEMNERVRENLCGIIASLEGICHESSTKR